MRGSTQSGSARSVKKDLTELASYSIIRGNIIKRTDEVIEIDIPGTSGIYPGASLVAVKDGESVGGGTVLSTNALSSTARVAVNELLVKGTRSASKTIDWVVFRRRMPSCDLNNPANLLIGEVCTVTFNENLMGKPWNAKARVYAAEIDLRGDITTLRLGDASEFNNVLKCKSEDISLLRAKSVSFEIDTVTGHLVTEAQLRIRVAARERQMEAERVEALRIAEKEMRERQAEIHRQREADRVALDEAARNGWIVPGDRNGSWTPAPGYRWRNPESLNDPSIPLYRRIATIWVPGLPHPTLPHIIAGTIEGRFSPEPGYRFVSDQPNDMRVTLDRASPNRSAPNRPAITGEQIIAGLVLFAGAAMALDAAFGSESRRSTNSSPRNSIECLGCSGTGTVFYSVPIPSQNGTRYEQKTRKCPTCNGRGSY